LVIKHGDKMKCTKAQTMRWIGYILRMGKEMRWKKTVWRPIV